MATKLAYFFLAALCICSVQATVAAAKALEFVLYTHEVEGGANSTVLAAAGTAQGNLTGLGWGSFLTVDNKLKEGPFAASTTVGRFTGFQAITTVGGIADGLLAVDQFRFSAGKYNGSAINIIGLLSSPADGPWELTVVGGTGFFRGYTGYAISRPYTPTTAPPLLVFKWNFYLNHA